MKYHGIIFNDSIDIIANKITGFIDSGYNKALPPVKTAGSYAISSICRQHGYNVKVFDNIVYLVTILDNWTKLKDWLDDNVSKDTVFFGFSTTFFDEWFRLQPLIEYLYFNFPDVKIICGGNGTQTWLFNKTFKDKIDTVFYGVSENTIIRFLKDSDAVPDFVEEHSFNPNEKYFEFADQPPMFHKTDTIMEGELLPLQVSRGCTFKCKFCAYPFLGRKLTDNYIRTETSLYNELRYNAEHFNTKYYVILDDTFNETTEKLLRVKKVKDEVSPDSKFWCYIRLELLERFPEQISILRDMGMISCQIGIESMNYEARKSIGKGITDEKLYKTMRKLKEAMGPSSAIHSGFVIGLPHDTRESVDMWANDLINRELPGLDTLTFSGLALALPKNQTNDYRNYSVSYYSEFDLNAEKYGYKRSMSPDAPNEAPWAHWWNDEWDANICNEMAYNYIKEYYKKNIDVTVFQMSQKGMSLFNLASIDDRYTVDHVFTKHKNAEERQNFIGDVKRKSPQLLEKYADNVFTK